MSTPPEADQHIKHQKEHRQGRTVMTDPPEAD